MRTTRVIAHCRSGFETECAEELATQLRGVRRIEATRGSALAVAAIEPADYRAIVNVLRSDDLVFARSIAFGDGPHEVSARDRIAPLLAHATRCDPPFTAIWLETPDSDEGKTRSGMLRRLSPLVEAAAAREGLLAPPGALQTRLHAIFVDAEHAYIAASDATTGSRWRMGIPRIAMPARAPSRSTLKLAEAVATFLPDDPSVLLRAGMRAVDLGAAPGGWTYQLVARGLLVTAIDNGRLAPQVMREPQVTHVVADGFHYRPRRSVDWMVCDMVEQPSRIARLAARWIAAGDCRCTIFNLKLPMKKRYAEVERCRDIVGTELRAARCRFRLRMKHLYHDREEVTAFCRRLD